MENQQNQKKSFGTAPVFFTAISTILGAILFLRFGFAVGTLGFSGVLLLIFLGHMVTIPTALSLSEIATNQRVEGGGEYFIISRSFGLNIGATIGIALYFSQAISVAFYVIAFTESFEPFFNLVRDRFGFTLPRQAISIPAMLILSYMILSRGANMGVKTLYIVVAVLFISILFFFLGKSSYSGNTSGLLTFDNESFSNSFFIVFAICFPAFTGMTAGVGLSGDLKNPGKSIPLGTTAATICGMITYVFISWKLAVSASPEELVNNQLIMSKIAYMGPVIIPLGLAASTISSAIGSVMVAPRTLQALGSDRSLPFGKVNSIISKGRGETNEPFNSTLFTCLIALIFVALGNVDAVAKIISMFFMVTYGSICLISFLYHFGADPSYRPSFRSRWYISLIGFLLCIWLMFKISTPYAIMAIVLMSLIYIFINYVHKDRGGMQSIFESAIFQLSRNIQVFNQRSKKSTDQRKWRPSVVCISSRSFEQSRAMKLLKWIAYRYGFCTYIHLIVDYFSKSSNARAQEVLDRLIEINEENSNVYLDTMISPSYTSAVAQVIQLPSISGMENNMILFEFDKEKPDNLKQIADNVALTRAGDLDICVLGISKREINFKNGIHVWIKTTDFENSNLMILLSYIILGHPEWKKGKIKIFNICKEKELGKTRENLLELIKAGRLPISPKNIEIIKSDENINAKKHINERSKDAGLTVIGFREEQLKFSRDVFLGYDDLGDVLFVNAHDMVAIT